MPRTLLSAARAPLAWLLIVAVAFLILLGLEHSGAARGPVTLNSHNSSSQSQTSDANDASKAKKDKKPKKDCKDKDKKGAEGSKKDKDDKHCQISDE